MERAKRRKRASVDDLYRSCAMGGDCIPDVQKKVEGRTLADILLKVFGSILYLGGLGIGTGRGTGGQFGYRPFGGTSRPPITTTPTRPAIPVEGINPVDILPVDPLGPAIVPLAEGLPDPAVIDVPGAGPGLPSETLDVTTALDDLSEVTGVGEHPFVTYNTDQVAQINIQVQPPPPTRVTLDSGVRDTVTDILSHASHVDSDYNVFVDAQMHAVNIGHAEEIELEEINLQQQFEIEDSPVESTPLSDRLITRTRNFYDKYIAQVPTRQVLSVATPRVTFEFKNPAFESDVTTIFNEEVQNLAAAAEPESTGILSDIRFSQSPGRTVRVSRLGQRLGMTTRSGLQIGQKVHLYYDVSPIPKDNIELRTFGEYSHESTVVDELLSTSFINPFEQPIQGTLEFPEDTLIDTLDETFNGHLIVTSTDDAGDTLHIPLLPPTVSVKVFIDDYGRDIFVYHPSTNTTDISTPSVPLYPVGPSYGFIAEGLDYDINPALLRRRKKRKYL